MPEPAPRASLKRLAIVAPTAFAAHRLRGGLIAFAQAHGCKVLVLTSSGSEAEQRALMDLGAEVRMVDFQPTMFGFLTRHRRAALLAEALVDWNAQSVLAFGASVLPVAAAAARKARSACFVPVISEIPGGALHARSLRRMRNVLRTAATIVVHNKDDARLVSTMLAKPAPNVVCVPGRGADLSIAPGVPMPVLDARGPDTPTQELNAPDRRSPDGRLVFLAVTRLDRVKGVHDYLEAARLARAKGVNAEFRLAARPGTTSNPVRPETLARYADSVTLLGNVADPIAAIRAAHIFVSPSHLEGMSPDVLGALAAARPLVATDIAGTREAVDEMVNGTLVPPQDPVRLAEGFERIVRNRALLPSFARASRAKAERVFAADDVNAKLLSALGMA